MNDLRDRPRILALGLLLAVFLNSSCARSCAGAPSRPDKLDAPAPPSPGAGRVRLAVTGAVERSIEAEGPSCRDWAGLADVRAKSEGAAPWEFVATPPHLTTNSSGEQGQSSGNMHLSLGEVDYVWHPLPNTGAGRFRKTGVDIDASLTRSGGTEVIQVKGSIECPDVERAPEIDSRVVLLLQDLSRRTPRRFSTFEFGRVKDARALSVVVPEGEADELVQRLRARLGTGWSAWRGTSRFVDEDKDYGVEVVVGAMRSPADILRQAHVDPVNYGMNTQDVVAKISAWHEAYGVDILQADTESVDLRFERLPPDARAFAAEVQEFCPDVVDQGYGSIDALVDQLRVHKRVALWWD